MNGVHRERESGEELGERERQRERAYEGDFCAERERERGMKLGRKG